MVTWGSDSSIQEALTHPDRWETLWKVKTYNCYDLKKYRWPPGSTASVNNNHQKTNTAQASPSRSRAACCSLNLLREAEVFDGWWRAAAGKIFLPRRLFNIIFVRSGKTLTLTTSWVTPGHVSLQQAPGYPQRNRQHSYIVQGSQIHYKLKSKIPQFAGWNGARSHR